MLFQKSFALTLICLHSRLRTDLFPFFDIDMFDVLN